MSFAILKAVLAFLLAGCLVVVLVLVPALFAHVRTLFVSHVRLRSLQSGGGKLRGRCARSLLSATLRFVSVQNDSVFIIASATRLVRGSS